MSISIEPEKHDHQWNQGQNIQYCEIDNCDAIKNKKTGTVGNLLRKKKE